MADEVRCTLTLVPVISSVFHARSAVQTVSHRVIVAAQQICNNSEYKHVLANILRSRYVARTPPLEARSPGRRSNVENASVNRWSLISNARTSHVN